MGTYTTATLVAGLLQVAAFGAGTTPTSTQVESIITRVEKLIEDRTGHAWQTRTISTYEYHDTDLPYQTNAGVPIYLKHRKIATLSSGSGDKVEVWDGSTWADWITTKTESRANDFWMDEDNGIIFLRTIASSQIGKRFCRVKYRYGESAVPGIVEEIATKLVAADIVTGDDRSALLPEGTDNVPLADKARQWREQAERLLDELREWNPGDS